MKVLEILHSGHDLGYRLYQVLVLSIGNRFGMKIAAHFLSDTLREVIMKRTQLTLLCSAFLLCFWLALPVSAALVVDFEGSASVVDNIADPFSPGIDITVDFSGVGPVWINFLEFPIGVGPHPLAISIINSTGVPWTDFHVESTGVDIDIDEMLITPLTGAISDFEVIENMVWIFFDPPEFVGIDIMGQHFHPLLVTNFSLHLAPSIPIPAAIWLFGSALGLLGLRRLV